jgi:hypothetical protein
MRDQGDALSQCSVPGACISPPRCGIRPPPMPGVHDALLHNPTPILLRHRPACQDHARLHPRSPGHRRLRGGQLVRSRPDQAKDRPAMTLVSCLVQPHGCNPVRKKAAQTRGRGQQVPGVTTRKKTKIFDGDSSSIDFRGHLAVRPLRTQIPWLGSSRALWRCVSRLSASFSALPPDSRISPVNTPMTSETRNNATRTSPVSVRDRMP